MLRRSLTVVSILAVLLTFFTVSGSASAASTRAASTSSSQIDFASLEKTCAVIQVHLNGVHHTVTCLQQTSRYSSIRPDTVTNSCSNSGKTLTVWASSANIEICFTGTGYLGYTVYDVNFVNSYITYSWVRYYHGGPGQFCNISRGVPAYFGGGNSNVLITQVNPGNFYQNAPLCPTY
jgi:hypothetical protein